MKLTNGVSTFDCIRIKKFPNFVYSPYKIVRYINIDGINHAVRFRTSSSCNGYLSFKDEFWLVKGYQHNIITNDKFYVFDWKPKQIRKKANHADKFELNYGVDCDGIIERNACVPRAISIAFDIPFLQALDILAAAGRKKNKGFRTVELLKPNFRLNGKKPVLLPLSKMTVNKFLQHFSKGTFIIRVRKHAFTIVDGKVHDLVLKLKTQILTAWRIVEDVKN